MRSGICPASPNESERKTMNSVHITRSRRWAGAGLQPQPGPARKENMIGKKA